VFEMRSHFLAEKVLQKSILLLGRSVFVFPCKFISLTHQITSNCSSAVGEENNLFLPLPLFPSERGAKNFNEIPIRTQSAINILRLRLPGEYVCVCFATHQKAICALDVVEFIKRACIFTYMHIRPLYNQPMCASPTHSHTWHNFANQSQSN
jgi:hypothetical protein